MARQTIKPAREGLIVKDPDTLIPIPAEGVEVEVSRSYWQRRLRDGDIKIVEAATQAQTASETTAAKAKKGDA